MSHEAPGAGRGAEIGQITEAPSLERAFLIDEHIARTGHAEAHWTYHHAPDKQYERPLVIVGGYFGIEAAYRPVATAAANQGLDVITIDPPRKQRADHAFHPDHLLHPERLLAQMTCRVVKNACDIYGIQSVDGAGHSMGGPGVTHAARRCPDRFHSITLWGSAGVSEHGLWQLASRVPAVASEAYGALPQLVRNFPLGTALSFLRYITTNPERTLGEAIAVSRSNIVQDIKVLGSLGVATAAMLYKKDGFFKPHEVAAKIAGSVDALEELNYGHLAPQTHPDEVVKAQVKILRSLAVTLPEAA